MREKTLFAVALVVSAVGIIVLAVIRPDVSPQSLQLEGRVERIDNRGKVSFIHFVPDDFTVIAFDSSGIEEGDQVLSGRLQEYKGKVEFVVDSTAGSPVVG